MAPAAVPPYRGVSLYRPASPYRPGLARIPVPWWALLVAVIGLGLVFLALQENGALLASQAQLLHEFFHDGRHALGMPCH